jgi:ribosomal protein S18 acetylase RimI-like enzyme
MLTAMNASATDVRRATAGDLPRMAELLATSFLDDPVFVHMLPLDAPRRAARLQHFFAMELPRSEAEGGAWTTADGAGAAVWYPPGRWKASLWQTLRQTPGMLRALGRQAFLGSQLLAAMQEHHPTRPHWYLLYVGVDADRRGQGIGGALLRPVLETCDEQHLPAYLEATNERNRALYRRHGFTDRPELALPAGGPAVRPMWREPTEPDHST